MKLHPGQNFIKPKHRKVSLDKTGQQCKLHSLTHCCVGAKVNSGSKLCQVLCLLSNLKLPFPKGQRDPVVQMFLDQSGKKLDIFFDIIALLVSGSHFWLGNLEQWMQFLRYGSFS